MSFSWPTFFFQVFNFLVLVLVLRRLLWRPLRAHMKKRAEEIAAGLDAVEKEKTALAASREEAARLEAEAMEVKRAAVEEAERQAEARRRELLEDAKRAAAAERERVLAQVTVEEHRREQEFLDSLSPTIAELTTKVITELAPDLRLHEEACLRLAEHLKRLDEDQRQNLAESERPPRIESATGAVPELLDRVVRSLVGKEAIIEAHPELIAGARVRIGDQVFDSSAATQVGRALGKE